MTEFLPPLEDDLKLYLVPRADGRVSFNGHLARAILASPYLMGLIGQAPPSQRQGTLFFAALHAQVLAHPAHPFARFYPTVTPSPAAPEGLGAELEDFARAQEGALCQILATRNTQTNETGRSAPLALAYGKAAAETGQALALLELGSSAGLNLILDRYFLDFGAWGQLGPAGSPVQIRPRWVGPRRPAHSPAPLPVVARLGVDLQPIDCRNPDDCRWLKACVFGDETDRFHRLSAALDLAQTAPPDLMRHDLADGIAPPLARLPADVHLVISNFWVLHYVPPHARARLITDIEALGQTRDLTWISAENPGVIPDSADPSPDPAQPHVSVLVETAFRGGVRRRRILARLHPHGRWVEWRA